MMDNLSIKEIFENGRTCNFFSEQEVQPSLLKEIYNLIKFGATSGNCSPLRITFVTSESAKIKLLSCVMEGNIAKIKSAPMVALFAYDLKFHEKLPTLFPHNPAFAKMFENNEQLANDTAFRNATLQAAYFMVIARGLGLDCGPMSGFNADKINNEFFAGTNYKINFICNLGYKAAPSEYPRLPRLDFDEVCNFT